MSKCCHYFHHDCMTEYIASEQRDDQHDFQRARIREIMGNEANVVQCPMCKSPKNTWQPFFPLGLEKSPEVASNVKLEPYVDYCSQLIVTHMNNTGVFYDAARGLMKSVLAVDIKNDPKDFLKQIMSACTHLVLSSVCLNNNKLLQPFDPSVQQNTIILRDVVFILLTVKELVKRICGDNDDKLKEIVDEVLVEISTSEFTANVFRKNYPKIIIQLLFITTVRFGKGDIENALKMKDAVIQAAYASFKGQVIVAELFRKGFGELEKDVLISTVKDLPDQAVETSSFDPLQANSDESVQSQLNFLRAAAAMSLSMDAVVECTLGQVDLESQDAVQLNLNMEMIAKIRE